MRRAARLTARTPSATCASACASTSWLRETEEQAWAELRQMFATVGDATRGGFGGRGESSESVGAKRQFALHRATRSTSTT